MRNPENLWGGLKDLAKKVSLKIEQGDQWAESHRRILRPVIIAGLLALIAAIGNDIANEPLPQPTPISTTAERPNQTLPPIEWPRGR